MFIRSAGRATTALALLCLTAACGSDATAGSSDDGRLGVVVGVYPLQFVAEQVGGEHVRVRNLTKPGAEPHDLELAPRDVAEVAEAGLVLQLPQLQPALDVAVRDNAADRALDVSTAARLGKHPEDDSPENDGGQDDLAESGSHDHGSHDQGSHDHGSHDHGSNDPHFWLDPTRLADVTTAVGDRMAQADPEHAEDYRANAVRLVTRLDELDTRLHDDLASCESRDLVTSHAAFGYLAHRYDLSEHSIGGLDPGQEVSAARLGELTAFVRDHGVRTVYAEKATDPAVAETLASEAGVQVKVLSPLETAPAQDAGTDYFAVMDSNLLTLRAGQGCR